MGIVPWKMAVQDSGQSVEKVGRVARITNTLRPNRNVVRVQVFVHTNYTRRPIQPGYARVRSGTVQIAAKSIKAPG